MRIFRNLSLLILIIIIFTVCLTAGSSDSLDEKKVSFDFKDASLKDVLKAFSIQSGMNFIASERIEDRKITLYMENVPVSSALDTILKANNLTYDQPPGTNIIMIKVMTVPAVETATRIYRLNYADPDTIKALFDSMSTAKQIQSTAADGASTSMSFLQGILSEFGKVASDKRTNSLIVTDIPSQFPMIEGAIAQLDEPTPQVMIEAEILEVSTDYMEKIGIYFEDNGMIQFTGAKKATRLPFITDERFSGLADSTTGYGTISTSMFQPLLNLLKENKKTKVLARPKILTLSNQQAEIQITANTAVATTTTDTESDRIYEQPERIQTGVKLVVTPIVNKDGFVTIDVAPEVTEPKDSPFFPGTYVDPHTRSAKATIRIKDGDTLVLGGLIKQDEDIRSRKVPVLGDLPIIGKIFNHDYKMDQSKELIIFITPHIVKDYHYGAAQAQSSLEREPSIDDSLNKEEAMERSLKELDK
ncbi:MAG: secretin N-terminal domain-containing protein [Candidatus Omnitrophica bacterium]|nr:secretin N-terminal domain-containing protein [Candidatus Omnitrophota bacterium]